MREAGFTLRGHRPRRRLLLWLALLVVGLVVGAPLVVSGWPEPLFPHRLELGNLYLRSDRPLDTDLPRVLADVGRRLAWLEIDEPDSGHRLFLVADPRRYALLARLLGVSPTSQGINAPLFHTIFLSGHRIETFRARYGARYRYSLVEGDLAHIITHEVVHTLIDRRIGFWASRRLPLWKKEGYAEYAAVAALLAEDDSEDVCDRLERLQLLQAEGVGPVRERYVLGQLLVEYLLTIEGWSFTELMADDTGAVEIRTRLESGVCRPSAGDRESGSSP